MSRTLRFRERTIRPEGGVGGSAPVLSPEPLRSANLQSASSSQVAVIQEAGGSTSNFTTTNTADWQTLVSFNITIPDGNHAISFDAGASFSHSAGPAEVSFRVVLFVDATLTSAYVLRQTSSYYLPTATKVGAVHLAFSYNLPSNLPNVLPGSRAMYFQAFNHTAGTLTVVGTTDTIGLSATVFGDVT